MRVKVGAGARASAAIIAVMATGAALSGCTAGASGTSGTIDLVVHADRWVAPLEHSAEVCAAEIPGVTINVSGLPYDGYSEAFKTQLIGGSAPDLMFLEPPAAADFATQGFLYPLDDALAADGGAWASQFGNGVLDASRAADGSNYVAPWALVSVVVAYREALYEAAGIDAAPATWDEWMDANQALADNGETPLNISLKGDDASTWWLLTNKLNAVLRPLVPEINLIHADGFSFDPNDLSSTVGETYTTDELYVAFKKGLIDPATSEAYRVAVEQVMEVMPFINDNTGSTVPAEVTSRFAASEVPQIVAVSQSLTNAAEEIKAAGEESDIRSFNLPTITEDDWDGLTAGGENPLSGWANGFAVNAASENPELAVKVLQCLTRPDVLTQMYAVQPIGEASAIAGVEYPADSVISGDSNALYAEISPYGFGMPPTFDAQDFDEFNAQWQKLLTGASTIDEFLAARSASNLAALERNLVVNAATVDQAFIDEQLK